MTGSNECSFGGQNAEQDNVFQVLLCSQTISNVICRSCRSYRLCSPLFVCLLCTFFLFSSIASPLMRMIVLCGLTDIVVLLQEWLNGFEYLLLSSLYLCFSFRSFSTLLTSILPHGVSMCFLNVSGRNSFRFCLLSMK